MGKLGEEIVGQARKHGLETKQIAKNRFKIYSPKRDDQLIVDSRWEYERKAQKQIHNWFLKFGIILSIIVLGFIVYGGLP